MKKERIEKKFLAELRKIPIVQVACQKCNVSRNTIYRWRKDDSEFAFKMDEALEEGESVADDLVESKLFSTIEKGTFSAIKYYLERKHPKYRKKLGLKKNMILRESKKP